MSAKTRRTAIPKGGWIGPAWHVKSGKSAQNKKGVEKPAKHRLFYKRQLVNSGLGLGGKQAMEAQAKLFNEKGLKPQKAGCRADLAPGARQAAMRKQGLTFSLGDAFPDEEPNAEVPSDQSAVIREEAG